MENFFYRGSRTEEAALSWFGEATALKKPSDFVPYLEQEEMNVDRSEHKNVKKRMVEMLRTRGSKMADARVVRNEKSFQHVLKERLRRQSHKDAFASLRAILPAATKFDKISIIKAAALEIMNMRRALEDLRRRNRELNGKLAAAEGRDRVEVDQGVRISVKMRVGHPVSGIDSLVEVLHCLKDMGLKIKRLRSQFTDQEFSAEIEMDSQIADDEVRKAVQRTLVDVEEKLLRQQYSML